MLIGVVLCIAKSAAVIAAGYEIVQIMLCQV